MKVLAFDVGIVHLAYSVVDYETLKIEKTKLTNLRTIISKCRDPNCTIEHSNENVDRMLHYFKMHKDTFDSAEIVLIERQPITGVVNIQDLLFMHFRSRAHLISPNKMHNYFNMSEDYEERKVFTEKMFVCASKTASAQMEYSKWCRKHDMGDSFCVAKYYIETQKALNRSESAPNRFESFAYDHSSASVKGSSPKRAAPL